MVPKRHPHKRGYRKPTPTSINPMPKDEAIKFAALHLEGVAHEWWHHRMVTLGHDQLTSYADFTERLIDHFDGKDPKLNFKELAQLKQTGVVDSYITEFQRLSVLVADILERRLVVLFMDGLMEPLKGWFIGFNPTTLTEAIKKAHDMANSSSSSKSKTYQTTSHVKGER